MARSIWPIAAALLALASCRSILDITPGRPLEDAGGAAGKTSSGGKSNSSMGGDESGGEAEPGNGGASAIGGKGSGGSAKGGSSAQAGASGMGGEGMGGEGPSPPESPFPEGACRDCMARNCPTEAQACSDDATCAESIPDWLACAGADADACVSDDPGALQDLEACGARSCDVCRHLSDDAPSVEILTPSNGAELVLDASGLIEVAVRVRNFNVKSLGQCGVDPACGHVHLNLDSGVTCRSTGFYNAWITSVDADGIAEAVVDTQYCTTSVIDRPLPLTASLSKSGSHEDRVPLVQSTVTVTLSE
jgi:hypothetical protein